MSHNPRSDESSPQDSRRLSSFLWIRLIAYAFAWGDFHKPAWSMFESIEDDWITREPWNTIKFFLRSRNYTKENL